MNMSYCRFHNTAADLRDCAEHIEDSVASMGEEEHRARLDLIETATILLEVLGYEVIKPERVEFHSDDCEHSHLDDNRACLDCGEGYVEEREDETEGSAK